MEPTPTKQCVCTSTQFDPIFRYDSPPPGEVKFLATKELQSENKYFREIHRCRCCGHFLSVHEMNLDNLYSGDYVAANYGGSAGLKKAFDRINRLPSEQSDNLERTNWVTKCYWQAVGDGVPSKLLDVGAGLGVFVYQMKKLGWDCLAIDPDKTSATHIAETAQVRSICADFRSSQEIKRLLEDEGPFNLITFNKVLEHVADPIGFLRNTNEILSSDGYVYIELPDAEGACLEGQNREEFFVDHIHIFSAASLSILVEKAGFRVNNLERIKEPSSKYTLRAFCSRL